MPGCQLWSTTAKYKRCPPPLPPPSPQVCALLWSLLPQLEELSPATSSVLQLLAQVYLIHTPTATSTRMDSEDAAGLAAVKSEDGAGLVGVKSEDGPGPPLPVECSLTQLVPRITPYLRHALSTVRLAAITCISRMLQVLLLPLHPHLAAAYTPYSSAAPVNPTNTHAPVNPTNT